MFMNFSSLVNTCFYSESCSSIIFVPLEGSTSEAATPHYNTCILQDMTHTACLECMYKAIDDAPGIRDGVALLKVWLHQRALDVVRDEQFNQSRNKYI